MMLRQSLPTGSGAHVSRLAALFTIVGADPSAVLATLNGRTGYVSVRRENKVKELDLSSF